MSAYRKVRPADENPQPGELVRSKWSHSGAVWEIERVEHRKYAEASKPHLRLFIRSLTSGRRDDRHAANLIIVKEKKA